MPVCSSLRLKVFMKSSCVNQKYPFTLDEFRSPGACRSKVRKHGLDKALSLYKDLVEDRYTDDYSLGGYPVSTRINKQFLADVGQVPGVRA